MSNQEIILDAFRSILRPIVREVLDEAKDTVSPAEQPHRSRFYSRQECCRRLSIGTTTFYRLAKKGKITILKIEGKTVVDADDFDRAVESREIFRYQH